jgi:hypothetical protein
LTRLRARAIELQEEECFMAEETSLTTRMAAWPAETKNYFEELHLAAYFEVVDSIVGRAIQKLFDTFTK